MSMPEPDESNVLLMVILLIVALGLTGLVAYGCAGISGVTR